MTSTPSFTVRVEREAPAAWDAFVETDPGGTFAHRSGWGGVLHDVFGHEPLYVSAWTGPRLVGVLPLARMPTLGLGKVVVSMPYLNYGGPLGTEDVRRALTERALAEARRSGARRLELRDRYAPAPVPALAPAREKVTVLLDLPADPEVLFQERFRSKLRSQVRRPMKEGMEARFGLDQREAFYDVFRRNMRDLGTPVLPARFFELLAGAFPERIEFGVVRHEGSPVAAGCGFHHGSEFEMTWASSLRELNHLAPNMLLYWRTMEHCIELGRTTFNFGRCTPGAGTHRFKLQWGSADEPLAWRQWPEGERAPDGDSAVFAWATRVWSHLPLPVADRLGPVLARRIPSF